MSQIPVTPPPPVVSTIVPPPPRAVTSVALQRSWAEMPVRVWVVMAIVLLVVIVYFTISRVVAGAGERAMILDGIAVTADVVQIAGTSNPEATYHRNET